MIVFDGLIEITAHTLKHTFYVSMLSYYVDIRYKHTENIQYVRVCNAYILSVTCDINSRGVSNNGTNNSRGQQQQDISNSSQQQ